MVGLRSKVGNPSRLPGGDSSWLLKFTWAVEIRQEHSQPRKHAEQRVGSGKAP